MRSTAAALKRAAAADDHDVLFATSPGPVLLGLAASPAAAVAWEEGL